IAGPATSPCCGVWVPACAGTTGGRVIFTSSFAGTTATNSDSTGSKRHIANHSRALHAPALGIIVSGGIVLGRAVVPEYDRALAPSAGGTDIPAPGPAQT